jgi:uncharacterized protein
MMHLRSLLLAVWIASAAGCISRGEVRHSYSLDQAVEVPAPADAVSEHAAIQLQRVLIPDYLDTTDIVLREGAHELHESSTGRFGERLSLGITHALRADLAARMPQYTVTLAQSGRSTARQILVNVDTFDVWTSGRCVLVADWTVLDGERGSPIAAGRGTFTNAGAGAGVKAGDGAIVAAMADVVRQLAEHIAPTAETASSGRIATSSRIPSR